MTTPTLNTSPVVSVVCDEPRGSVIRHVYFMELSRENLMTLWEKSRKFPTLFSNEIVSKNFNEFLNLFLNFVGDDITPNGLFYVVDDFVGVYYMTNIDPGVDAMVHYSFFDQRHRGRVGLTREMIRFCFEEYGFERLTAELPTYVTHHTNDFITQVGFKFEGQRRRCIKFKGEWYNKKLYGILRSEVFDGVTD